MKMLLERKEVNPHMPDSEGRTQLLYAAGNRSGSITAEGMVKLLLRWDEVNPIREIRRAEHRSRLPLRKDMRE